MCDDEWARLTRLFRVYPRVQLALWFFSRLDADPGVGDGFGVPPLPPMVLHFLNPLINQPVRLTRESLTQKLACNWWRQAIATEAFGDNEIQALTQIAPRLRELCCSAGCSGFNLALFPHLRTLELGGRTIITCDTPVTSRWICRLENLRLRAVEGVSAWLPNLFDSCPSLTDLTLWRTDVVGTSAVMGFQALRTLNLAHCSKFATLQDASLPQSLTALDLSNTVVSNADVAQLGWLPRLRLLELNQCYSVSNISGLSSSTSLTELGLKWTSVGDAGLSGLDRIPTLTRVDLHLSDIDTLGDLAKSASLQYLRVKGTGFSAAGFVSLRAASSLHTLDAEKCPQLEELFSESVSDAALQLGITPALFFKQHYSLLTNLDLSRSRVTAEDLDGLGSMSKLETLRLARCGRLTHVNFLSGCMTLRSVDVSETGVTHVEGLRDLPSLEVVNLRQCRSLTAVNSLSTCPRLTEIYLFQTSVTGVGLRGIEQLPKLKTLNLCGCRAMDDVNVFLGHEGGFPALRTLWLLDSGIPRVAGPAIARALTLREFDLV